MTRFNSDPDDLFIFGEHTIYASARSTGNNSNDGDALFAGQNYYSGWYSVRKGFLRFDTSAIPDADTVTAVSLGLTCSQDSSDTDFSVYLYKYDWKEVPDGSGADGNEVLRDDVFDMGVAGSRSGVAAVKETAEVGTAGKSQYSVYEFTALDTTWVAKTGWTYYAIRSSRDVDNIAPTGAEYVAFYVGETTIEAYRPYLDVTYSTASGSQSARFYADGVISPVPFNG